MWNYSECCIGLQPEVFLEDGALFVDLMGGSIDERVLVGGEEVASDDSFGGGSNHTNY